MSNFNRVILMGNLTRDPEIRATPSGTPVAELRLAVNEVYRSKSSGERIERTCYVDVSVWGQAVEVCRQYLFKGSPLLLEGRLQYDEWKNPQGETRSKIYVRADRLQLVGGAQRGGAAASAPEPAGGAKDDPGAGPTRAPAEPDDEPDFDDEPPF